MLLEEIWLLIMATSGILLLMVILILKKALMKLIYKEVLFILHFWCLSVDTKCTVIPNHTFLNNCGKNNQTAVKI